MSSNLKTTDIALAFKGISISDLSPPDSIVSNVSGFIRKGGITAVFGASASGKSLLLKALSGRVQDLAVTGETFIDGAVVNPADISNDVAFVSQESSLIGDLTPREMLYNSASLKAITSGEVVHEDVIHDRVEGVLEEFGLSHVAGTFIGTPFRTGISGGQKRRVDVGVEFISPPSILLLDEPTSGLDSSIAFDTLKAIRSRVTSTTLPSLSVALSIHQPNARMLDLFDHILLLGEQGEMSFFGTVQESVSHFASIGYPLDSSGGLTGGGEAPTDLFLKVTAESYQRVSCGQKQMPPSVMSAATDYASVGSSSVPLDFPSAFLSSPHFFRLMQLLEDIQYWGEENALRTILGTTSAASPSAIGVPPSKSLSVNMYPSTAAGGASLWRGLSGVSILAKQCRILLKRDIIITLRDPSLFALQLVLMVSYGFLTGASFFQLEYVIDETLMIVPSALCWIIMIHCYVNIFKMYHLNKASVRSVHDIANGSYSPLASFLSQSVMTAFLMLCNCVGAVIAYFMMGFPTESLPFYILLCWASGATAEAMLNLGSKLVGSLSASVVSAHLLLVVCNVFAGGMMIRWDEVPVYWQWLQSLSLFTHATRAGMLKVMRQLTYECDLQEDGVCYGVDGNVFMCEEMSGSLSETATKCDVSGDTVLDVTQGINADESHWTSFSYLALLYIAFQCANLFLMYFPMKRILFLLQRDVLMSSFGLISITSKVQLRAVEGQLKRVQMHVLGKSHMTKQLSVESEASDKHGHLLWNNRDVGANESPVRDEHSSPTLASNSYTVKNYSEILGGDSGRYVARTRLPFDNDSSASAVDAPPMSSGRTLYWTALSLTLKSGSSKGKVLLDNLFGYVRPGNVMALMGPSGAGKTTLLNALANRAPYGNVTGSIMFGNTPLLPSDLVFIPQFDDIKEYATVLEQVSFVGAMTCTDVKDMNGRLLSLLEVLGLARKAHVLCRDLTGGELKRVSICMGMIANPRVLFLDEPTTGLDSAAAHSLVEYLVQLAKTTNIPMIMTIHQPSPSVFMMLQELYLLQAGHLAYSGAMKSTAEYFCTLGYDCPKDVNPADFFLEVISNPPSVTELSTSTKTHLDGDVEMGAPTRQDDWGKHFEASAVGVQLHADLADIGRPLSSSLSSLRNKVVSLSLTPSVGQRLYIQTEFFLRYYVVNPGYYVYRFVFMILGGLFSGTMFLNLEPFTDRIGEYAGAVFFSILIVLFSCVGSTGLFATERQQTFEQIKNGIVSPGVYCVAQFLATIPYNTICAILFQSIFHWCSGISPFWEAYVYGIVLTIGLLSNFEAMMYVVVEVVKDPMLTTTMSMVVLGAMCLMSGFFVPVHDLPEWFNAMPIILPTKYAFDGYLHVIFHNQDFDNGNSGDTVSGADVLEFIFGQERDVNAWAMLGVVFVILLAVRVLHFAMLYRSAMPFLTQSKKATDDIPTEKDVLSLPPPVAGKRSVSDSTALDKKKEYAMVPQ